MAANYKTVTDAGNDAPWLVFVHGISHDHRVFSEQVRAFRSSYRILCIDLPGHGISSEIPGPYGHKELTRHVRESIDQAGAWPCHYWASHTGTALGLMMAVDNPDGFLSMILEGAIIPGAPPPSAVAEINKAQETIQSDGIKAAKQQWFEKAAWFDVIRARPRECRADEHRGIIMDFKAGPWTYDKPAEPVTFEEEQLCSLNTPVLLYNGENDLLDFLDVAAKLDAVLPNAERHLLPEAGGFAAWEFPKRVNQLVGRHLART